MPKARRVIWLPEATRDVDRLRGFVELKNSHAARRAGRTILKAVDRIKENPGLGRPVEELPEFREIIVPFSSSTYIIRYRCIEDAIVVVRVWHSREEVRTV
jgi:plasmid stabilization system protein ParE